MSWFQRSVVVVSSLFGGFVLHASIASAEWTPLVTSGMFTGIQTDVTTVITAVIGIFILIVGFSILVSVFTR